MTTTSDPKGIHRRIECELTDSLVKRFWQRVQKSDDGCWEWQGAVRNGYGAIKHDGHVLGTHVVAYRIHHGDIPIDHIVRHSCDNRLCVNPDHLMIGTHRDNVVDMVERRKIRAPRGEETYNAVLDEQKVREILAARKTTGWGHVRIAKSIGVNPNTVKGVLAGRTWRHVKQEFEKATT